MSIWPLPRKQEVGDSVVWLSSDVRPRFSGAAIEEQPHLKDSLNEAFKRMWSDVFEYGFVPFKFQPQGARFEPALSRVPAISKVIVNVTGDAVLRPEVYGLNITIEGNAYIVAATPAAVKHAFATFSQLFYPHSHDMGLLYTRFAPVVIEDWPDFEHRGLSLDIARNRISPEAVERVIEAMSFNKLNRLHLHAWDSQSWPLEIETLPQLAEQGCYDSSQIWTASCLERVQRLGSARGVEVYLDADMPGHTASIHHAYPDLIAAYNMQPWEEYAQQPPSGQLKLNSQEVYHFLERLFGDLLPRVSRHSSHMQVGGGEINRRVYELEDTVQSSRDSVLRPLIQRFMNYVIFKVDGHGLTPIVWEEALLEWNLNLPKHSIIQAWKSEHSLAAIVARGYRGLASNHTYWCLDSGRGSWLDPRANDLETPVRPPFSDWNAPFKNWRHMLSYDPLAGIPDERQHLVLGGEVFLWSELADEANLDELLWPRVCAAAEVLWRGKGEVNEASTRRLAEMRERLVAMGYRAGVVQMEWCLQNPGNATL